MTHNTAITLIDKRPTPDEYNAIRKNVGWHCINPERVQLALNNALFSVCAVKNNDVIGLGRIVGDGAVYFYIQDVIVSPQYQRCGVGHRIMQRLMAYLNQHASPQSGAFIGLMTAPDTAAFYARYGFHLQPDDSPLMVMWKNGH